MEKLLVHACCGPCFTYINYDLKTNGLPLEDGNRQKVEFTACFYNPNIHPKVEYERRKEAFEALCKMENTDYVILDEYDLNGYVENVITKVKFEKQYESRCEYCYNLRLEEAFKYAKENGYSAVTTTLTISPYQNHEIIKKVGKKLEEKYNIKFIYLDYREHFREGQKMAKEKGIYMQKYCGCVFSFDSGRWKY